MEKIYKLAIIGAGQLGSRHLQSLRTIRELSCSIFVIDLNPDSLRIAQERYEQIESNSNVKEIHFSDNFSDLPAEIDFLIIATGSRGRADLIKNICNNSVVRFMLIEKVLFQKVEECEEINQLFCRLGIKAWVNCPRRMFPIYRDLKAKLDKCSPSYLIVDGSNWGLGCNSIHFIDLCAYLFDDVSYTISTDLLDRKIIDSKRLGYKELTGCLKVTFSKGSILILSSRKQEGTPLTIYLSNRKVEMKIDESGKKIVSLGGDSSLERGVCSFEIPFQSQLTAQVVESALLKGNTLLTPYVESTRLHLPFIASLIDYFKESGFNDDNCPVT